jgi:hypothetical protein
LGKINSLIERRLIDVRRIRRSPDQPRPPRIHIGQPDRLLAQRRAFPRSNRPRKPLEPSLQIVKPLLRRQPVVLYSLGFDSESSNSFSDCTQVTLISLGSCSSTSFSICTSFK